MPILGIIVPPISDVTFFMNFGSHRDLPGGTNVGGRSTSPGLCLSTFWLIIAISPSVFDVFRFTGFPVLVRERFPLEIYLSQRESRRSIPERQPVCNTTRLACQRHGGGFSLAALAAPGNLDAHDAGNLEFIDRATFRSEGFSLMWYVVPAQAGLGRDS